jgi:hypothetical protein
MYGYENKSGLLGSTVVGFVFSSINVGVTIFYQVGERWDLHTNHHHHCI